MGFGSGRAMSHDSVGEDMEGMGDREETEESGVDVKTEGGEAHKSSDIVFHKSCMSMAERHRARCECISVRVLAYMLTRACVCCLSVFLSFMHMLSFRCACVVLSVQASTRTQACKQAHARIHACMCMHVLSFRLSLLHCHLPQTPSAGCIMCVYAPSAGCINTERRMHHVRVCTERRMYQHRAPDASCACMHMMHMMHTHTPLVCVCVMCVYTQYVCVGVWVSCLLLHAACMILMNACLNLRLPSVEHHEWQARAAASVAREIQGSRGRPRGLASPAASALEQLVRGCVCVYVCSLVCGCRVEG